MRIICKFSNKIFNFQKRKKTKKYLQKFYEKNSSKKAINKHLNEFLNLLIWLNTDNHIN